MFEKVNPGHPDKMADRLAGAVVDLVYERAGGLTKARSAHSDACLSKNPRVACEVMALTDMTPKATYQPSDEINQAIKGATLSWATEKDEKEGTETPANGDDNTPGGELEG